MKQPEKYKSNKSFQYLIVSSEEVDPGNLGVDLLHLWLHQLPLAHQSGTQTTPGRPVTDSKC